MKTTTTIPIEQRDYYCSMKFRYLKIDLESQTTYTCHAAQPHKIDFDWLSRNPGRLFNHDINITERQMMLANQRAPSCEQNCWYAEDQAQISPRIHQKGYVRSHGHIETTPEIIDFTVSPQCNLTCSYCCKEFSSSWRQDLADNGEYQLQWQTDDRYRLTNKDRVLMKVSQPTLMGSKAYTTLLKEISLVSKNLKRLDVTGGEPFLNNELAEILNDLDLPADAVINIYTGLGVDTRRLARILDLLDPKCPVEICVSAECIGRHFEFNRYGLRWDKFQENLKLITDRGIKFHFNSTLTNLTAFGFVDFVDHYPGHDINLTFAYQPRMQTIHVMDDTSKKNLLEKFACLPEYLSTQLTSTIGPDPTNEDRQNMAQFLRQFCRRRSDLDMSIYPRSFLSWLEI